MRHHRRRSRRPTYVLIDFTCPDCEEDVEVTYHFPEPQTRHHPGSPALIEDGECPNENCEHGAFDEDALAAEAAGIIEDHRY